MYFYRLLGADLPEDPAEDHVEATMPNGTRLMFDAEEVIRSFLPDWTRANGNQVSLAFECASVTEVDEVYDGGLRGREGTVGRLLGPALRAPRRSGRRSDQPVRGSSLTASSRSQRS